MSITHTFPTVFWDDLQVTFLPEPKPQGNVTPFAVVVFARHRDGFVLANVPGRGWITPSGRLEPGETPLEAAIRETREEIGAELLGARPIGRYILRGPKGEGRIAEAFVGQVDEYGDIPSGSESVGTRLARKEELPGIYWRWDELLEVMFEYAQRVLSDER